MKPPEIKAEAKNLIEIQKRIIELKLEIANQERTQHDTIPQPAIDKKR